MRGEWVTGLHIVNNSARAQVVKLRFRRATDAMDALDFNLVMSPHDVNEKSRPRGTAFTLVAEAPGQM